MTTNPPRARAVADRFPAALALFRDASPELLEQRLLQRRVDRKFVFAARLLDALSTQLCTHFSVIRAGTAPLATYHTVYFDTPSRQMYEDHRRGRLPRHKVRVRHHVERRLSFLEVKCKSADGRTTKARTRRPFGEVMFDGDATTFLARYCSMSRDVLVPRLWMTFRRITLAGDAVDERVTIDCDLEFVADMMRRPLPGIAVVEIKQRAYRNDTPSIRALRALHIRERGFSKYCLGTAMLAPVRSQPFRETLRLLERLSV